MLISAHPADLRGKKKLIYAKRNPSAVSSDKDKQSELLLIKKKKEKDPSDLLLPQVQIGRKGKKLVLSGLARNNGAL